MNKKSYYEIETGLVFEIRKCEKCGRLIKYYPADKSEESCLCGQIIKEQTGLLKKLKRILGYTMVIYGGLTWFIPATASIFILFGGLALLGISKKDLIVYKRVSGYKFKNGHIKQSLKYKCDKLFKKGVFA